MKSEFTLKEYIAFNKLGVDPRDTPGMKMVANHLKELGYTKERRRLAENGGKTELVYTMKDKKARMEELAEKLRVLAERKKV